MNCTEFQYHFRIIMTGRTVGKTCLMKRYTHGLYPENTGITIGVDWNNHILEVEPGVRVQIQIVDTPGQELIRNIMHQIFPRLMPAGCLLVFDLGDHSSFSYVKQCHAEMCNTVNPYTGLFVLVGHKCDRKEREVYQDEVENFASELGVPYIEASAKTGHNVAEVFELLTRRIYQSYLSGEMSMHPGQGKIHDYNPAESNTNKDEPAENNKCCAS